MAKSYISYLKNGIQNGYFIGIKVSLLVFDFTEYFLNIHNYQTLNIKYSFS